MSPDVVVIGAGHNGLVAAVRLARAGRRVVVLERRDRPGGLCAAEEFHPGYTAPGLLHDTTTFRPKVARALGLKLRWRREAPAVFAPSADGPGLMLSRDPQRAASEIGALSQKDAEAYVRWREFLDRVRGAVSGLLDRPPPAVALEGLSQLWQIARPAWALRRLGRREMTELLRILPMSVADWLRESFETELLSELLAGPAVLGTFMGPWSPGSAANLLFHECRSDRLVEGGPTAVVEALTAAAQTAGVETRTGAWVEKIRVRDGRVAGVTLFGGEEVDAPVVAATCDPKTTFLRLVPAADLPVAVVQRFRAFRARGTTAKVHLALAGPLEFRGRPEARLEWVRIGGGSLDHLERAFDAVKYGRFSPAPHLDIHVPTVTSPELAPPGHHVASILVSFVPDDLEGGWTAGQREALGEAVTAVLTRYAPDLRERVVAREVLVPPEIADRYGLAGGHVHHGEHALDQLLFLRPTLCSARYRTPIGGLFLAGSGSHPGGGITGMPGLLGAEAILRAS